ncbi:hypothetical protein ACSQ67_025408 [Phaseolus vulgaris]
MTLLLGPPGSGKTTLLLALAGKLEMLAELLRREKAQIKPYPDIDAYMKAAALGRQRTSVVTDSILKILGLEVCADIMAGDGMISGISRGQKKRAQQNMTINPGIKFSKFKLLCELPWLPLNIEESSAGSRH